MLRSLLTVFLVLVGQAAAQPSQVDTLRVQTQYSSIPLTELRSGGPPPNGIPPLGFGGDPSGLADTPAVRYESVAQGRSWLSAHEPVILVTVGGESGIFPLQVLLWHEIANVTLGGVPLAVTFCPLCNTSLVVDRRVPIAQTLRARLAPNTPLKGDTLLVTFGVSGLLYRSDLVMFDSATHSLWYQAVGRALVGPLSGAVLRSYPSLIVSFDEAAREAPRSRVLSKQTGYARDYGRNPYAGYDAADQPPFLFSGPLDGRLPPKERVVTVSSDGFDAAYPFTVLARQGVVNDRVGSLPITVWWAAGTLSALDGERLQDSRDVGAGVAFDRRVKGRTLTFQAADGSVRDSETRSTWTVTGRAVSGPLRGEQLSLAPHTNQFWFSWAVYAPGTRVYAPP